MQRGRIVGWISATALAGVVAWGLWRPDSAPDFFTWPVAQLLIILSALQTIAQLAIDQRKGLIRIGPERTRIWRVGGLPRTYVSAKVSITIGEERGQLLLDDRPIGRLELFDIRDAFAGLRDG